MGTATPIKQGTSLNKLFATMAAAMGDTISSLIDKPVKPSAGTLELTDSCTIIDNLSARTAVIRGALDKDFAGKTLFFLVDASDATAMSGFMMMTPDDVIAERRVSGNLEGEDLEAFGEVGNVLCSGVDEVMRKRISQPIGMRLQDHGVVRPQLDEDDLLGNQPLVEYRFSLQLSDYPATDGRILIDVESAELWNGRPLNDPEEPGDGEPGEVEEASAAAEDRGQADELEPFEDIPAAPIRGKLSCYVTDPKIYDIARRACRRAGLEMTRRGKSEVPNPAAHRNELVLLDVPVTEARRFDWCKRLKLNEPSAKVILLIHHPSRTRVVQGYMAKADVLLGWPLGDLDLAEKLTAMLDRQEA